MHFRDNQPVDNLWITWEDNIRNIRYQDIQICDHLIIGCNPLRSDIVNISVSGRPSLLLVVENGKIKMLCWDCAAKAVQL
jgi:radical SAM superfamily enzyme